MEDLKPGYEWADVLVMVKTYPAPSAKHGETVCVAGVRLDGEFGPSFIRLYPISFRALEDSAQFKKYEIIRVPVIARGSYDPRPESYLPDVDRLQHLTEKPVPSAGNWVKRQELIEPLFGEVTMCELVARNRAGSMSDSIQSLGLIKPERIRSVKIEEGKPWKPNQLEKVKRFSQADLLNPDGHPELQPVPYQLLIDYICREPGCMGHKQHLIDWELGVAGLKWPLQYGSSTAAMLQGKYQRDLDMETKDVYLFVGNQHQRRQTFSVCGIWFPKKA